MEEPMKYSVVEFDDGQQVMVKAPEAAEVKVYISDVGDGKKTDLAINDQEFNDLLKQSETNDIPDVTIKTKAI